MFARTPRLLLRPGWMEDAPALAAAIGNDAVLRNLTGTPAPYTLTDAQAFLAMTHDERLPHLLAFTRTRGAPRLVGGCGLRMAEDGVPELDYWIVRSYWGLGFATEAVRAIMSIARANRLPSVRGVHFADNPASGHVLRKVGFRPSGRVESRFNPIRGGMADCRILEEGKEARISADLAMDLYDDACPALAA